MGDDATQKNGESKPPKNTSGKTVNGVRNGQRKPVKKATRVEVEERIEWLVEFIQDHPFATRTEIHRLFRERYDIEYLTTDLIYVKRARERIAKQVNVTPQEAKDRGLSLLFKLARNGRDQVKLAAEKRIAEIFGYDAPRVTRLGDVDGKNLPAPVIAPTIVFALPEQKPLSNGNGHTIVLPEVKQVGNGK